MFLKFWREIILSFVNLSFSFGGKLFMTDFMMGILESVRTYIFIEEKIVI